MKMPRMLILTSAGIVVLGMIAISQQRVAKPGELQDMESFIAERFGSAFGIKAQTEVASSSSNGMGEGGAGFAGTYEELVGGGGNPEIRIDRGIQRAVFSVDAGGSNILLVATTYHRWFNQGTFWDTDPNNHIVYTTKLEAIDLSNGVVLWTTSLGHDETND